MTSPQSNGTAPKPISTPPVLDLVAEACLDPALEISATQADPVPTAAATHILLTGATGFLGAYLLHALLQQRSATIYCLVRAADAPSGLARIQAKLAANALWEERFRSRIVPVIGDLAQPNLGLTQAHFDELATQIEVIYHNGALVNFILPYRALRAANVAGTQEVIRLAVQGQRKAIHYVSTVFVFGPRAATPVRTVSETEPLSAEDELVIGYFQSKWVAEQLLAQARARGVPITIYRPGVIVGESRHGRWDNHDDFLCRLIKGCIQLGCWPAVNADLPVAPVDLVAQAIVHLAQQPASASQIYHLVTTASLGMAQLGGWLQDFGYPLTALPLPLWQQTLRQAARTPQDNALALLLPLLVKRLSAASPLTLPELFLAERAPRFVNAQTRAALATSGLDFTAITAAQVTRYLHDFVAQGFLASPHPTAPEMIDYKENAL